MNVNYVYGIIFLFLTSCLSPTDRVIPSLLRADSLIEVGCADSALSLLERMSCLLYSLELVMPYC